MSESQLPEDYRSRIQQGFAASLLLTSLLFFWILVASNEPPRGGGGLTNQLAAGCLPPKQLAAGSPPTPVSNFPVAILHLAPCRQVLGRQAPCRPSSWRQGGIFAKFSNREVFLQFKILKNVKM